MDALQDFFKEARNRVNNPLIFSFVAAWLLCNWRIPLGLLAYNYSTIKQFGDYKNFDDLITKNASWDNFLYHPLKYAILYTIFAPLLRICIIAGMNWVKKIGDKWNKNILKNSTVPMSRFIKETDKTDNLSRKLEELYTKDGAIKTENDELKFKINESDNKIVELQSILKGEERRRTDSESTAIDNAKLLESANEKIAKLKERTDPQLIKGTWKVIYSMTPITDELIKSDDGKYRFIFEGRNINFVNDIMAYKWGEILSFIHDVDKDIVDLTLKISATEGERFETDSPKKVYYQELVIARFKGNSRVMGMEGKDSDGYYVKYIRELPPVQIKNV